MNIYDFEANLIKFTTKKIVSGRALWVDLHSLDEAEPRVDGSWSEAAFLDHFAYVIEGNQHFEEIEYAAEYKDMYAEIYGGSVNGGSGRAGNLNQFQVKGVGQTMLVGKHADSWHAYGCFSLVEALLETVNSVSLNEILPCGTVKCLGLILTGEITAWPPNSNVAGRGALLVRESCLRPAHFFYNDRFAPKAKFKHLFLNDKLRVKRITQKLSVLVDGPDGYNQFLQKFLDNYANQFSYSKIFRIFHGAINGSNVSLDGRWLDLTTASFVDSGKNYVGAENIPSFYAEHCTVLNFIESLLAVYRIYNVTAPQKEGLVKFYAIKYKEHMHKHVFTLLGLDADCYSPVFGEDSDFSAIVSSVWNTIVQKQDFVKVLPSVLSDSDPLVCLLEEWFLLLQSSLVDCSSVDCSVVETQASALNVSVLRFFSNITSSFLEENRKLAFLNAMAIKSLKKAYFSEFLFKRRIEKLVTENINTSDFSFFSNIINDCKSVSKWVFNDSHANTIIMYDSNDLKIYFNENKNIFEVCFLNDCITFCDAARLLDFIVNLDEVYFTICSYSFKKNLIRLCKILCFGAGCTRSNTSLKEPLSEIAENT